MGGTMIHKFLLRFSGFAAAFTALLPLNATAYDCANECPNQFCLDVDYLYWQIQDSPKIIPLVIEQPLVDGPFTVVLGGKKITNDWHSGAKISLGYWFDTFERLGVEGSYFFLGENSKSSSFTSNANGSPRLRVPYFNVTTGLPDSTALATPGLYQGSAILKTSDWMQGAELNIVKEICPINFTTFKVLAGFRYWNLDDNLKFSANSPLISPPSVYFNQDKFNTQNNFYGGQIGASFNQCFLSSFFVDIKGKVALGAMCQQSTIKGYFQTNEFTGSVETFEGGYFALPTNIGNRSQTCFAVIPELNLNIGCQITDCLSIHVGYTALYVSNVLRASKQMSSDVNPTQSANIEFTPTPVLVGAPSPQAKFKSSSLWIQGVNAGLDYIF